MSNDNSEEATTVQQLGEEGSGEPSKTEDSPTTITSFNADLLCCHGKLLSSKLSKSLFKLRR